MIIAKIRHLIEWFTTTPFGIVRQQRDRIAELEDELARERAQRQLDAMLREAEIARLIRHMAKMQLALHRREVSPLMLDGYEAER